MVNLWSPYKMGVIGKLHLISGSLDTLHKRDGATECTIAITDTQLHFTSMEEEWCLSAALNPRGGAGT